jgi:hypothetical protein
MRIRRAGLALAVGIATALLATAGAAVAVEPDSKAPNQTTVMPRG